MFKVKCKNNIRDEKWNYLLYKINGIYEAEIIVTEDKDYIQVFSEVVNSSIFSYSKLFTFKSFSENFKIIE